MSKFKYYIDHPALIGEQEIFHFGEEKFSHERESGEIFYKFKFDSELSIGGSDQKYKDSYDVLKLIDDSVDRCEDASLRIELLCESGWQQFFVGILSMNESSFDEDKCVMTVPVNPNDTVDCIANNDQKVNILNGTTPVNMSLTDSNVYEFLMCPDNCTPFPCNGEQLTVDGWKILVQKCTNILPDTGILRTALDQTGGTVAPYTKIDGRYLCYYHSTEDEFQVYHYDTDTTTTILSTNQDVRPFDISGDYIGLYSSQFNTVYIYEISTDTLTVVAVGILIMGDDDLCVGGDYLVYHDTNLNNLMIYEISTLTLSVIEATNTVEEVSCDGVNVLYFQTQGLDQVQLYNIAGASITTIVSGGTYVDGILSGNNVFYEDTQGVDTLHHYNITTTINTTIITNNSFNNIHAEGTTVKYEDGIDVFIWTEGIGITQLSTSVPAFSSVGDSYLKCGRVYWRFDNTFVGQSFHHLYEIATTTDTIFRQNLIILEPFDSVELMNDSIVYEIGSTLFEYEFFTATEITLIGSGAFVFFSSDCTSVAFYNTTTNDLHYYRGRIGNKAKIKIYYREKIILPCDGIEPIEPTGSGWTLFDDDCAGSGFATWVRVPLLTPTVIESTCPLGVPVPPPPPNVYHLIGCDEGVSYYTDLGEPFVYDRFRRLDEVILRVVNRVCPDVTEVVSDFFQINPENVSLTDFVTGLPTKINHLLIAQKSDFKDPLSSEAATLGEIEFAELMQYLFDMFQCYWFIEDGKLRIEHIVHFLVANGLDLTVDKYEQFLIHENRYTYDSNLQKEDTFSFMEAENTDFVGLPIKYNKADGTKSACVSTETTSHDVGRITTDIDFINTKIAQGKEDDIDDDGFVIVSTTQQTAVDYTVIQEAGKITGLTLNNGPLSFANLNDAYWKHDRPIAKGFLNGLFTTFESEKRIKKQDQFFIPFCCNEIKTFDPTKLTTVPNYGQSEYDRAEWDGQKDTLILDLIS